MIRPSRKRRFSLSDGWNPTRNGSPACWKRGRCWNPASRTGLSAWWVTGRKNAPFREFCAEHRLEHVSFEGFQNPAPYYEQASLLLLTSEYEGFGLVIVEGMSFGVSPIVYGSFSAAYDLVDHGKDGCILPAASGFQAHRMAEMAAGLMREPADLHAMARNAIAKSRKFTREHIIPQWEKAFRPDAS